MPRPKNYKYRKLKPRTPDELMNISVRLPAYLLQDVKTYGDTAKVVRRALKLSLQSKFKEALTEIIGDVGKEIEKLELFRDSESDRIDEPHLQLLELYKDIYFKLKKARILKRQKI